MPAINTFCPVATPPDIPDHHVMVSGRCNLLRGIGDFDLRVSANLRICLRCEGFLHVEQVGPRRWGWCVACYRTYLLDGPIVTARLEE